LRAIELARAFADHGEVDRYALRRRAFAQRRDTEYEHELFAGGERGGESHPDAAVGRAHGPGAFHVGIAPIELRLDCAIDARPQIAGVVRQTACVDRFGFGGRRLAVGSLCMGFAQDQRGKRT